MDNSMPILLIPGLVSSPRIYAPVMPALWRCGPVTVANHIRDDNMGAMARRILAEAPPRFALAGHSMGGYIAFEIMRQAPQRVAKLALINTQARPDTPGATPPRRRPVARADSRPTLAWIKGPTLVLAGDEDNTIPNSLSVEMADGIPGAKLVILAACGHLPQPEQPQA